MGPAKLVYAHDPKVPSSFCSQALHARFQPLLVFTIDGASYIENTDPKWEVVAAVLQRQGEDDVLVSCSTQLLTAACYMCMQGSYTGVQ